MRAGRVVATAGVVAAVGIVGYGLASGDPDRFDSPQAVGACAEATADLLREPESARFSDIDVEPHEGVGWFVTGTVRARNGFGGMAVNGLACSVAPDDEGGWSASAVIGSRYDR
jgi:hypothetical protein